MRFLLYYLPRPVNVGTPERPVWEAHRGELCMLPYTRENARRASLEAWGPITIEDDDESEP